MGEISVETITGRHKKYTVLQWCYPIPDWSNKGLEEWDGFLDDAALATVFLERLSYLCNREQISGKSYRIRKQEIIFIKQKCWILFGG